MIFVELEHLDWAMQINLLHVDSYTFLAAIFPLDEGHQLVGVLISLHHCDFIDVVLPADILGLPALARVIVRLLPSALLGGWTCRRGL